MKEPHRLLNQGATDAERALLRSASMDGPPDGVVERMMTALDGAPSAQGPGHGSDGTVPDAPAATHALKLATLAKAGVVALLGVAGLTSAVMVHYRDGSGRAHVRSPAPAAPAIQTTPALDPTHGPSHSEGTSLQARPSALGPSEGATEPQQQPSTRSDDSLAAELRLLDVARAAVHAGNSSAAQRALDSHAERFPQGHLKPEANVLRLAVMVRQGDHAAALSLGRALLASELYKTYEPRIRSLLREIPQ
jgi:hypothetical protein